MTSPVSDDHRRFHNVDPDTSVEAAARLTTGLTDQIALLSVHCRQVQRLGERYTGLADFESGDLAGIDHWNARKRCHELREQGFLRFSGDRRTNPESNRANAVSVLTAAGAEAYLQLHSCTPSGQLATLIRRERPAKWNADGQGELF
jgi:hypothetical protein